MVQFRVLELIFTYSTSSATRFNQSSLPCTVVAGYGFRSRDTQDFSASVMSDADVKLMFLESQ